MHDSDLGHHAQKDHAPQPGHWRRKWSEYGVFFREFLRNFHTTGAVLPSGRFLSMALTRYLREPAGPRRVLEVGPGTGAVTQRIVASLGAEDRLDLVELNEAFVHRLRERFAHEPRFRAVADRATIHHMAVEELPQDAPYDLIISGLPLNNFSVALVTQILNTLSRLLKPGGILSFFEYIAVRRARALVSNQAERERLRGIGEAIGRVLHGSEIRRDWIWPNVPPAWVHHVRF
jgi:phosphatidylethanolamine/phosphatidyl-N-methylethanolamine N-methyltransferase